MSVISTWIEDFPQIILVVIFAVWSSEVISNVQYAKADMQFLKPRYIL